MYFSLLQCFIATELQGITMNTVTYKVHDQTGPSLFPHCRRINPASPPVSCAASLVALLSPPSQHLCRTYNQLWAEALLDLNRLLYKERQADTPRPEKDRVLFFQRVAMLYVRYIQILRKLEEVYDQVVHPQKRMDIRAILDSVMGRIMELKNEMVDKEYSEYHYVDDVVQDLKLRPVRVTFVANLYEAACADETVSIPAF